MKKRIRRSEKRTRGRSDEEKKRERLFIAQLVYRLFQLVVVLFLFLLLLLLLHSTTAAVFAVCLLRR